MLNFLNIESIVVCCLCLNVYNTTTDVTGPTWDIAAILFSIHLDFWKSWESKQSDKKYSFRPKTAKCGRCKHVSVDVTRKIGPRLEQIRKIQEVSRSLAIFGHTLDDYMFSIPPIPWPDLDQTRIGGCSPGSLRRAIGRLSTKNQLKTKKNSGQPVSGI